MARKRSVTLVLLMRVGQAVFCDGIKQAPRRILPICEKTRLGSGHLEQGGLHVLQHLAQGPKQTLVG